MQLTSAAIVGLLTVVSALVPSPFGRDATRSIEERQASSPFPSAGGYSKLSFAMSITGVFDGGMKRFDRGSE